MPFMIGELLVKEKMITVLQLEEALKHQVLYGGRIGISLIEMGFVKEEDIARMLSKKFKLPFIAPERLDHIPSEVMAQIPSELAVRHYVVPIALEGKKLTVAMADPTDLDAIDEIAFRTGLVILPVVTPELSLTHALKKYYNIERELHSEVSGLALAERKVRSCGVAGRERLGAEASWGGRELEKSDFEQSHLRLVERTTQEFSPSDDGIVTLEAASQSLTEINHCNEAAAILIRFAAQNFNNVALFRIRGDLALGWTTNAEEGLEKGFSEFQVPLDDPSVLKTLVDSKESYTGPVPFSLMNGRVLSSFGGTFQDSAMLVPLIISSRVIAVLYVDGEKIHAKDCLVELQQLAVKSAMALEILILKKKIQLL